jgi:hypothetical protein
MDDQEAILAEFANMKTKRSNEKKQIELLDRPCKVGEPHPNRSL